MSELPDLIPFAKVQAFLRELGIEPSDCVHVHLNLDHVEVRTIRRRDKAALAAGDDLSTVTTTIGYLRTEPLRDEPRPHAA